MLWLLLNTLLISWKLHSFHLFEEKNRTPLQFRGRNIFYRKTFLSPLTSLSFHGTDKQLTFSLARPAKITQHLYCKYASSYLSVRIWEQFLQLESQLELCQNLRQVAATAAVKGSHFSFKLPLLFVRAVQNSSESVTL